MQPGDRLGIYFLQHRIGMGASGVVYAAEDSAGRQVAIKVLHREHAKNAELMLRFLNEKRISEVVAHPGIVRIMDSGLLPGNVPYLVMERMAGTLANLVNTGPLPLSDTLRITAQLAHAAAALHSHGVIHRDLKPGNVMLAPAPARIAKLADFGLAKITAPPTTDGVDLRLVSTAVDALLGTMEYRAPEQWVRSKDVDGLADVYSLGVVLHELLAGRPPFMAERESELMSLHLFVTVPAPLRAPATVASLLSRMLAKSRSERPHMHEVAAELTRIIPI